MTQQAGALATYEGALGGVQASIDGEDVWDGITKGAMHGGMMGGIAGFVGGGLAHKNAEIISKLEGKGRLGKIGKEATEDVIPVGLAKGEV